MDFPMAWLVELIGYREDIKLADKTVAPIFKRADLVKLYTKQIERAGGRCIQSNSLHRSSAALLENTELWIAFGTGKYLRYIPGHDIARALGGERAVALPCPHLYWMRHCILIRRHGEENCFRYLEVILMRSLQYSPDSENLASFNENTMPVMETHMIHCIAVWQNNLWDECGLCYKTSIFHER